MPSGPSPTTGPPPPNDPPPPNFQQRSWLRSPEGQWSRIEQAFAEHLEAPTFRDEALQLGLNPDELDLPQGTTAEKLARYRQANPALELIHPKDTYPLAVGMLKMLALPPEE